MSLPRFSALSGGLVLWAALGGQTFAQAAAPAAGGAADGGLLAGPFGMLPFLAMFGIAFYFLIMRPQSQRQKQHQAMLSAIKRGDTVVLSSGMIGKVTRVEDAEAMLEIATGVNVRVVKSMITEVRTRGEPAKVAAPTKSNARGAKSAKTAKQAEPAASDEESDEADAS